jgi:hypothetical protein
VDVDVGACCALCSLGMRVEGMWFHGYCMMQIGFGRHAARSAAKVNRRSCIKMDVEMLSTGLVAYYVPLFGADRRGAAVRTVVSSLLEKDRRRAGQGSKNASSARGEATGAEICRPQRLAGSQRYR